jgi:LuxR family maltose regulon positive regulatory protein
LLSAPAGFGKTTLASEWLRQLDVPAAWVSLDESDNDPVRFMAYFIAALQTLALPHGDATQSQVEGIEANIGKGALSVLQSLQPPPAEAILTSLINEITAIPGQIILVLDDYHLIEAQPIHDALGFLLEHLPPRMHLVIATREDPPLSLARLRARSQLTELRAADLRFTPSEAAEFLNQVMGLNLSAKEIAALETRTEGWIAGLQLAALSMQGLQDTTSFIDSFTGSHRFVLDYLVEEVLQRQPERVRTFLLQTSILDRLSGPLCDAVCSSGTAVRFGRAKSPSSSGGTAVRFGAADVTDKVNGQATLEMLERANLFVVPLDNERRWYRYHHLFADVLQAHLMEEQSHQVPDLHRRASEWYEQNGRRADAIRHALAAEDFERAASLIELAWPAMDGTLQFTMWLGWAKALPDELVRARPVLSVAYASTSLMVGELEASEARLRDAERWLDAAADVSERLEAPSSETCPEQSQSGSRRESRRMVVVDEAQFRSLPAMIATARAYYAQAVGDVPATVKYARRILELSSEEDHLERGRAMTLLGLAHWASGDLEAAHRSFADFMAIMRIAGNVPNAISGAFVLGDIRMAQGRLHEACNTHQQSLQLAASYGEPMPSGTEDLYRGMSELCREWGDLEAATQHLLTSKKLGEQVAQTVFQYRWCIAQARIKEAQRDLDGALDLLDEAERLYIQSPLPNVCPIAASKARVWVRQGRLAEALAWAREQGLCVDDDLSYLREFEHVTLARVLIAEYRSDRADRSILEAMGLLERLLKAAEKGERMGSVIEILMLQALAHQAQDNIPLALAPLERALALAEPEGYVRLFVDEGQPVARLLYKALSRGIAPDYVRQLLAAFPSAEPEQTDALKTQAPKSDLIEPLSERELEVLGLIAEGLTNQEIASRLFLSLHTIKVHARNIYGKLGVRNRTQAVTRARALGILPST